MAKRRFSVKVGDIIKITRTYRHGVVFSEVYAVGRLMKVMRIDTAVGSHEITYLDVRVEGGDKAGKILPRVPVKYFQ